MSAYCGPSSDHGQPPGTPDNTIQVVDGTSFYVSNRMPFGGTVDLGGPTASGTVLDVTNSAVTVSLAFGGQSTIDLHGHSDRLDITGAGSSTINLDRNVVLHGDISTSRGGIVINGGIYEPGQVTTSFTSSVAINATTIGGTFNIDGGLAGGVSFLGRVDGSVINMGGGGSAALQIDAPRSFAGLIDINSSFGAIDLKGLAASSYVYRNDLLSFYQGNRLVDVVRLNDSDTGFAVANTANGIQISYAFAPLVTGPSHIAIPPLS